ncbi:DUF1343 domain-containing protein [candidate division KSB1 bacterium]|nr:DUF1343 domain-containing protein [candidate division KSB1 bacterium]
MQHLKILFSSCLILLTCGHQGTYSGTLPKGQVLSGIDVLVKNNFNILAGKRVGLITNHTGRSRDGKSDIDILAEAPNVNLVKLFCPEHGIRGTDDEKVDDGIDSATNLPIISLYGKNREPTGEMVDDIDVLVFDIQDIGCRFYTYISTMAHAMRAARKFDKEMVVLDRPNPIGGVKVEGTIPPDSLTGKFTAIFPIPTQHAMTVGELANMFNDAFGIGCKLTVVPLENWTRSMYWDDTGLAWRNPSPNMKTLTGAILYTGLGILETTNLSMGRGTDIPFEIYGAPWLDGEALAAKMNAYGLAGIRFVPWEFVPTANWHKYRGEKCRGVKVTIYDRAALDAYLAALYMLKTIWEQHPDQYQFLGGFQVQMGCAQTEGWIKAGLSPEEIKSRKLPEFKKFMKIRATYLLY